MIIQCVKSNFIIVIRGIWNAGDLPMVNGVYQLDYDDGRLQTFTKAYVGYELEYVGWTTDNFQGCTWDYCEDVPL